MDSGSANVEAETGTGPAALFGQLRQNPAGLWGLGLSLLQLLGHASWLSLVVGLSGTADAEKLNTTSLLAWLIVGVLGASLLLTAAALFVCLFYGLRRSPRARQLSGRRWRFSWACWFRLRCSFRG
ncbi:MAG UNVERIFIED_CONTAM: hypothetical protein LVR18_51505 [Planctomycetaceae bacterium]